MLLLAGFCLPGVFHDPVALGSRGWDYGLRWKELSEGCLYWYCPKSSPAHFIPYNTGESGTYILPCTRSDRGREVT